MSVRAALAAVLSRLCVRKRASRPPAPPAHVPPAFCRKPPRQCSEPFCTCEDAAMVEGAIPPVKHRELYADRFEVEGESFTDN